MRRLIRRPVHHALLLVFTFSSIMAARPVLAESISEKVEAQQSVSDETVLDTTKEKDWQISVSLTYSWPSLKEANKDVHKVEAQLRQIAPVKRFQDWDDIYKGTVGIGIARRFRAFGMNWWPELIVGYGKGDIKTEETNIPTVFRAPLDYKCKQIYTFWNGNLGPFLELYNRCGLSLQIGTYLTFGHLDADTRFESRVAAIGINRNVRGDFGEYAVGFAPMIKFSFEPDCYRGFGIVASFRYDFQEFEGTAHLRDVQSSPQATQIIHFDQKSIIDMTGPSLAVGILYKF